MDNPNKKIIDFAHKAGFDYVEFFSRYKNENVFVAENIGDITFTGYPTFIVNDNEPRFTTPDETLDIMGIKTIDSPVSEFL